MAEFKRQQRERGFNIIELMVVLAIISILAVIAMPVYQGYATRAKVSEGINAAGGLQTEIAEFYNTNQFFPQDGGTFRGTAGNNESFFSGNYVKSIVIESCQIKVIFDLADLGETTLKVKPWYDSGLYIWSYNNQDSDAIDSDWLPSSTRSLLISEEEKPTETATHCCGTRNASGEFQKVDGEGGACS